MHSNQIENIPEQIFSNNTNLEYLDLSSNQIKTISAILFTNNVNLKVVHLENNQIETLDKTTFSNLSNLQNLYLFYNQIQYFEPDLFTNNPLTWSYSTWRKQDSRVENINHNIYEGNPLGRAIFPKNHDLGMRSIF